MNASLAGLLVVNEMDYPSWRANVALRAVEVPAGRHRIEMIFEPVSVQIGIGLSGLMWIAGLSIGAWLLRPRR